MAYSVQFLTDNIILQTGHGMYTTTEMADASEEITGLMNTLNRPCVVMVDLTRMKHVETKLVQIKDGVRPLFTHANLSLIIAYGNSDVSIINFIGSFVANLFKIPVKIMKNQEEVIAYLVNQNAALDGQLQAALQRANEQEV